MNDNHIKCQESLLHILLKYDDTLKDFVNSSLKAKHFSPNYRLLVDAIFDFEARGSKVTRTGYRDYVERCNKTKLEIIAEEAVYNRVYTMVGIKEDDFSSLSNKVREFYVRQMARDYIDDYSKKQTQDAIYAAKDLAEKLSGTVNDIEVNHNIIFDTIDSPEFTKQWRKELHEKETSDKPRILCGISEIDECMGIGFHPSTLTVICADVAGYKSTMMLNIAMNVFKINGKDVLFVPLEMPRNRMFDKLISRELKLSFGKFQNPRGSFDSAGKQFNHLTTQDKDRIEEEISKWEALQHKFAILDMGERTTVLSIRRQVEKHISHHKPCLVVIDYIANLVADRPRREGNHLEIGDMLMDLIQMGKPGASTSEGFAILTGAQLGRDALKKIKAQKDMSKQILGSEDIQGSHQYSTYATNIFGQIKDPAQPDKKLHVVCIKSRYGKTTFGPNNISKTTLNVQPDFSLIESCTSNTIKAGDWGDKAANDMLLQFNKQKPPKMDVGFEELEEEEVKSGTQDDLDGW